MSTVINFDDDSSSDEEEVPEELTRKQEEAKELIRKLNKTRKNNEQLFK